MDAVLGVLSTISGILTMVLDILGKFSLLLFLGGFFGILLAFLWFFCKYLDKKNLALPTVAFTLCFVIFLSGNLLLIYRDAKSAGASSEDAEAAQTIGAEPDQTEPEEAEGAVI